MNAATIQSGEGLLIMKTILRDALFALVFCVCLLAHGVSERHAIASPGIPAGNKRPALSLAQAGSASLSALEQAINDEINRVRKSPSAYADWIVANRRKLPYSPKKKAVLNEAIRALRRTPTLSPLSVSQGLHLSALDIVNDQLPQAEFSHTGTDGSYIEDRQKRYGTVQGGSGEDAIIFYSPTAVRMVLAWIVDDFAPDRGHRKTILRPTLRFLGTACKEYPASNKGLAGATLCVSDFADGFVEK
jgi:uncharacterized protein YkwD